jgi:ATP-GRASP peptide maturase of grasp-with-spasm system
MIKKKVVIMSSESDISTNKVVSCLNTELSRISSSTPIDKIKEVCKSDYTFWYRRDIVQKAIGVHPFFGTEWSTIQSFFHFNLDKNAQSSLGNYSKEINNNKLINLKIAADNGLRIPHYDVISTKKALAVFKNKFHRVVVKPAWNLTSFIQNGVNYNTKNTVLSTSTNLDNISTSFLPSFVQEYIDKKYELRIFFLRGKFYSMAIFSQLDEQTQLDYRNYNRKKPNRAVPYQLPPTIERKLLSFMKEIDLDTGSIDIMFGTDNKYYFLEVNPVGQFEWLNENCNYYIEKEIATLLMHG